MRGRAGTAAVPALLAATAAATGGLVGAAAGALWHLAGWPAPLPMVAVGVVAAAVAADVAALRLGRPRPPSVGRQVPQLWSRLFAPPVVAVLYGARLGIGPATVLPTWLWWAAFVLGASAGPLVAAVAGGVFGVARGLSLAAAAAWLRPDAPARMGRLRGLEQPAAAALLVGALAALALPA